MKTTCYYYILKAVAKKAGQTYTYYKIGEADTKSRPDSLCKKYTKTDNKLKSTMTCLLFEELPTNKVKRLNDKTIHANIDPTIMTKVDRNLILGIFNEVDGYNEFFELKNQAIDVVLYIKGLVAKLGADDHNFTAKAKETSIRLSYADSQVHCVKGDLLRQLRTFGKLNLSRDEDKNILLIGQFAPSWVATFAMENNVTILHDSADQEIIYTDFIDLTKNINYIQDVDDLFEGDFKNMKFEFDLIITNVPYGKIGADIVKKIRETVSFKEWINLEPGNDYFTNDNYKYIDPTIKPIVLGSNAFSDANQATTITRISKQQNNLTQTGARLLVSIQNKDEAVYKALGELWLNTEKTYLKFTQSKRDLEYDEDTFVFNPGAFDIHHGYFAVAQKSNWTSSTEYNIYHKDANGHINLPKAKVKGCLQFKKLVYSELGLKMFKLWFTSSPEGWGFANGMFADIDYSDCLTWSDVFTKLNVSEDNQKTLIEAAEKFELNDKEKEICKIVEETL